MAFLRALFLFLGVILAAFGTFFALQGAGVIMWPAESFMLAQGRWVTYGIAIAVVGVLLIVLPRQMRRRG